MAFLKRLVGDGKTKKEEEDEEVEDVAMAPSEPLAADPAPALWDKLKKVGDKERTLGFDLTRAKADVIAVRLAEVLERHMYLKDVRLAGTGRPTLGSDGLGYLNPPAMYRLFASLRTNMVLSRLTLTKCDISGEAVRSLCQVLCGNQTLLFLDISFNRLRSSAGHIAEALERNHGLRQWVMTSCELGPEELTLLCPAVRLNAGLRKLDVSGNDGIKTVKKELKEAFEDNKWLSHLAWGPSKSDAWHKKVIYDNALAAITHDIKDLLPLDHRRLNLSRANLSSLSSDSISLAPIFEDIKNHSKDKKDKEKDKTDKGKATKQPQLAGVGAAQGELSIEDFILFKNNVSVIDADVCRLNSLVRLCLLSNRLKSLPAELGELQRLEELDVGYNQISDLPASFADLPLKRFYYNFNQLTKLPAALCNHTSLEVIDLRGNKLATLPEVLHWPKLTRLFLHCNQLVHLGPGLAGASQLRELWLQDNKLTTLPSELRTMTTLTELLLEGNPMKCMGPGWDAPGTTGVKAVMEYVRLVDEESNAFATARLIVLGEPRVGKTSVVHDLVKAAGGKARRRRKEGAAPIEVDEWDAAGLTFRTVDFASEGVELQVPRFFLSKRSLYIVVFNAVTALKDLDAIGFWLASIDQRARGAPLLLVGTHAEHESIQGDAWEALRARLQQRFGPPRHPHLQDVMRVSHKSGTGFNELKERLVAIAQMKKYGPFARPVPPAYTHLSRFLAAAAAECKAREHVPWIDWNEVKAMGASLGLEGVALGDALSWLSDIGQVLYYREEENGLDHAVFLEPSWLPEVLRTLDSLKEDLLKDGRLQSRYLPLIFKDAPAALNEVLLALLQRFEVLHPLENVGEDKGGKLGFADAPQTYLLPSLLPERAPDYSLVWLRNDTTRVEIRRQYAFEFLPQGLFSRLTIRMFKLASVNLYWRRGFICAQRGAIALVLVHEKTISIAARGSSSPVSLMRLVCATLDSLVTGWFHVAVKRSVPCTHCLSKAAQAQHAHMLQTRASTPSVVNLSWSDAQGTGQGSHIAPTPSSREISKSITTLAPPSHPTLHPQATSNSLPTSPSAPLAGMSGAASSAHLPKSPRNSFAGAALAASEPHSFSVEELDEAAAACHTSIKCPRDNTDVSIAQLMPDVVLTENTDLPLVAWQGADLDVGKELARGAYGIIYKAEWRKDAMAAKEFIVPPDTPLVDIYSEFRREVSIMGLLKHPNVVNAKAFCLKPYAIVMELVPCGDLYKFLHPTAADGTSGNRAPSDSMRMKIAFDIALGMRFLHSLRPPLLHRDLKSLNVLMSATEPNAPVVAKIADFGLSSVMFNSSIRERAANRAVANPTWLAPEVLKETGYSMSSDVYAFGIILHEILTGKHPFDEYKTSFMRDIEDLVVSGRRPSVPNDTDEEFKALMEACWSSKADARPTFDEAVRQLVAMWDRLSELPVPTVPPLPVEEVLNIGVPSAVNFAANAPNASETSVKGELVKSIGLDHQRPTAAMQAAQRVWLGTKAGALLCLQPENGDLLGLFPNVHPSGVAVVALAASPTGALWVGCADGSVRVLHFDEKLSYNEAKKMLKKELVSSHSFPISVAGAKARKYNAVLKPADMRILFNDEKKHIELQRASIEASPNPQEVTIRTQGGEVFVLTITDAQERSNWSAALLELCSGGHKAGTGARTIANGVKGAAGTLREVGTQNLGAHVQVLQYTYVHSCIAAVPLDSMAVRFYTAGDTPTLLQEVLLTASDEALDGTVAALCEAEGQVFVAVGTSVVGLKGPMTEIRCAQRLAGHMFAVTALAPMCEGRLASASPGELKIWKAGTGELLRTVAENEASLYPLCMLKTGPSLWSAFRTPAEMKVMEQDLKREKAAAILGTSNTHVTANTPASMRGGTGSHLGNSGPPRLLVRDGTSFDALAKLHPAFNEPIVAQLLVNSLTVWVISSEARIDIFA